MHWKAKIATVAFGAALFAGITIPAASASTSDYPLCNVSGNALYGCAMAHGSLKAVTLVAPGTSHLTNFSYNSVTGQFQQASSSLCLEFNASSKTYPVRMDTCHDIPSQTWILAATTSQGPPAFELENSDSGTCLEGSETIGFGNQLTLSSCAPDYNGEFWNFEPS